MIKLTDEQITAAWDAHVVPVFGKNGINPIVFARAIEAKVLRLNGGGGEAGEWEGAEEWERLAWHLCAEENGEDACNDLIWEGGPQPEPWGDRWMKYEPEAKRLIALVRKYAPQPQQAAPGAVLDGWQPIETAPKDGTWILLMGGTCDGDEGDIDNRPVTAQWTDYLNGSTAQHYGRWQFSWYDGGYYGEYRDPTHWMPLPAAPSAPKPQGE